MMQTCDWDWGSTGVEMPGVPEGVPVLLPTRRSMIPWYVIPLNLGS
jgi:hypothetical protein